MSGAAVKRAGLPAGTTSHDLRHHFASVLLANGDSVTAVAAWLGHANSVLVQTTYAHLMPNAESRSWDILAAAWAESVDSVWTGKAH